MLQINEVDVDLRIREIEPEILPLKMLSIEVISKEWLIIFGIVNDSKDETELRRRIKRFRFAHFVYGFGGSHFWCKQILDNETLSQGNTFFCEFNEKEGGKK